MPMSHLVELVLPALLLEDDSVLGLGGHGLSHRVHLGSHSEAVSLGWKNKKVHLEEGLKSIYNG